MTEKTVKGSTTIPNAGSTVDTSSKALGKVIYSKAGVNCRARAIHAQLGKTSYILFNYSKKGK